MIPRSIRQRLRPRSVFRLPENFKDRRQQLLFACVDSKLGNSDGTQSRTLRFGDLVVRHCSQSGESGDLGYALTQINGYFKRQGCANHPG
ncbi:MAG: hypothetical protein AAF585_04765 [Verrucomicrobiota bacterium]